MPTVVAIPYFQQDLYDREGNVFVISKVQYDGTNGNTFFVPAGATAGTAPAAFNPTGASVPTPTVANTALPLANFQAPCTVTLPSGSTSGQIYVISMHPGRSPGGSR
jgi:hypothetical protein